MANKPSDTAVTEDLQAADTKPHSVSSAPKSSLSGAAQMAGDWRTRASNAPDGMRRGVLLALVFLLALFAGFLGGKMSDSGTGLESGSLSSEKKVVTSQSQLISQIAKTVGPSVVSVNVTVASQSSSTDIFGFGGTQTPTEQQGAGTGIIISSSGLVLTNRHVVPDGTQSVSVTLADGTELKDVSVVGRTNSGDSLDVAILKINNAKGHKLEPARLGDSSQVVVGDAVVAIGNALGQFQNTVTSGIISGHGRSVQASDASGTQASENLDDLFQTDAAINEGNSGGPLVNMNGQVIGLNTAIAGGAQNIGFAIPINDITGLIRSVTQKGSFQRPFLGVRYIPITADYAYQYNLPVQQGAYIAPSTDGQPSIVAGSAAERAGLKEKDIITAVNGTAIDQTHSLTSLLDKHAVGDTVQLTVRRGDKTIKLDVTLAAEPKNNANN